MALPTDRVQLTKQESTALGGDDADTAEWGPTPIEPQEDAIEAAGYYGQDAAHRDETVLIWRENERWMAKDPTYGVVELLGASAGSGITAAQHKALRQLVHFVETNSPGDGFGAGPYVSEVLPTGNPFPESETWHTDATKTEKICREEVTYNNNKTFATQTWIVYKADGVNPEAQAVDTIFYQGVVETGRSRAVTVYP